jgi:hypothetical protein
MIILTVNCFGAFSLGAAYRLLHRALAMRACETCLGITSFLLYFTRRHIAAQPPRSSVQLVKSMNVMYSAKLNPVIGLLCRA